MTFLATASQVGLSTALLETSNTGVVGLLTMIPKLVAALYTYGASTLWASIQTQGLSATLKLLNIHPVMFALSALTLVIGGAIWAYDTFTTSTEEHAEQLAKTGQEYSELTTKLQSINSELATTKQRIEELESKDSLTLVEQNELQKLKETNAELERQKALTDRQQKLKGQEVSKEFVETMESFRSDDGSVTLTKTKSDYVKTGEDWDATTRRTGDPLNPGEEYTYDRRVGTTSHVQFEADAAEYYYKKYLYYQDKIKNAGANKDSSSYEKQIKIAQDEISKLNDSTSEYVESLEGIDYEFLTDDAKDAYDYWFDIGNKALLTAEDAAENYDTVFNSVFNYGKYSEANKALSDLGDNGELTAEKIQELYNGNENVKEMIDYLAELGLIDLSDIDKAFEGLADQINEVKEVTDNAVSSIENFDDVIEKIDKIQETYKNISSVFKDYNTNGFLSIDNLQTLLSLDTKYLQALVDENGQLSLNTDTYWKYIDAQLTELELSKVQSILDTVNGMSLEEAQIYATAKAKDAETESTISLIEAMFTQAQLEAQLKDNEQNTTAYTDALNASIPSINSVVGLIEKARNNYKEYGSAVIDGSTATEEHTDALEKEKDILEKEKESLEDKKSTLNDLKDDYSEAITSIKDLIDWTQKYIEQTKNDEIEALEDKKNSIDDLIDKQKELLEAEKDEYIWNKEIAEKQNTVESNALSSAIANLDDSSAGQKAAKEANDTLNESRNDIKDSLYEHEIEVRENALDEMKEKSDEYYDNQIDSIQEFLDDEVALYRAACEMIDNDNGTLYGNLLNYCRTYTTTTEAEFNYMWDSAQQALQEYNIANLGTFDLMNNLQSRMYEVDSAIDNITDSISSYENRINSIQTKIDNLSQAAKDATNDIQNTINLSNQQQDSIRSKWYYDWQGKRYESVLKDRETAIRDILSQIENKYGGSLPGSTATIYSSIKKYAKGTKSAQGGLSLVGEKGAEFRVLNQGDGIIPAELTKRLIELGSDPVEYLSKAYNNVLENLMSQSMLNSTIEEMFGKLPNVPMGNAIQNTNSIAPAIYINIQGDATQTTVRALQSEADKIVKRATENVMNIALRNKDII